MSTKANALVCYHANCVDGLFAARNFHNYIEEAHHDVTYHPINYGTDEQLGFDGDLEAFDVIFFVDFCPTAPILRTLLENEDRKIVVLDHHERAKINLMSFPAHQYNNLIAVLADNLSGAGLVESMAGDLNLWPFYERLEGNELRTFTTQQGVELLTNCDIERHIDIDLLDNFTKIVQGRDLWLNGTVEKQKGLYLDAFLKHHKLVQTPPDKLDSILITFGDFDAIVSSGQLIFETVNALCAHMLKYALPGSIEINDTKVDVLVGMCIQGYASTFGELGYSNKPNPTIVIGIQAYTNEGRVELSFRCNDGANVDAIAHDLFNGGGHVKASGARMEADTYSPSNILARVLHYIQSNPEKVLTQ